MRKEGILSITKRVLEYLKKNKSCSINSVSTSLKIHWNTSLKVLEFLKDIDLVKEEPGDKRFKKDRLFSLK